MAAKGKYDIQAKRFKGRTEEYLAAVDKGNVIANVKIGLTVLRKAKKNVPVRTGNLRASGFVVTDTEVAEAGGKFKRGQAIGKGSATKLAEQKAINESRHRGILNDAKSELESRHNKGSRGGAVGFSAIYALSVHENPNAGSIGAGLDLDLPVFVRGEKKGKRKPAQDVHSRVGGWKFLKKAYDESREQMKKIYKSETRKQIKAKFDQ